MTLAHPEATCVKSAFLLAFSFMVTFWRAAEVFFLGNGYLFFQSNYRHVLVSWMMFHIGQLLVVRIYEINHIQRMKRYEFVRYGMDVCRCLVETHNYDLWQEINNDNFFTKHIHIFPWQCSFGGRRARRRRRSLVIEGLPVGTGDLMVFGHPAAYPSIEGHSTRPTSNQHGSQTWQSK